MAMPAATALEPITATTDQLLSVQIHPDLAAAEPVWRALEASGGHTPYQRYDWLKAYADASFSPPGKLAIMVLTRAQTPIALLPFEIVTRFGLRIARLLGMPISNGDAPVFNPAYAHLLTPTALRRALQQLPADLVTFHCVPENLGKIVNPLKLLGGSPAPDHLYINALAPGDAPYIEQSLPHKRRTNIRRSQRRLEEAFGPIRLHRAATEAEVDEFLEVFIDQRGRRFVQMGVENVFASPAFRRFFRTLAVQGLGQSRPSLSLDVLYAGERIVATSIGTFGPSHYSQYINSTDYGEASRYSLMGVTLSFLVDALRADGITGLDMGLGDFDYKTDWTHREVVYDIVLPVSPLGQIAAPSLRTARSVKRKIKQTPALWRVARTARSSVAAVKRKLKP